MQKAPTTSTSNATYDLVSILYHELQAEQACEAYAADANQEGKQDCVSFFHEIQQDARKRAEQAKKLLGIQSH